MEKQAFLPIKFYPVKSWQEYEKFKKYDGDKALLKDHHTIPPAFQMVMPDEGRHFGTIDFDLGTMEMVNYDDGTQHDITTAFFFNQPTVYNVAGAHRNLILNRFPAAYVFPSGRYYYHFLEVENETHWYSEVFELCDFDLSVVGAIFDNDTGFLSFVSNYFAATEYVDVQFCKTGAALAEAYIDLEVFLGEELDLYIQTGDTGGATCGGIVRDWDEPVFFMLKTPDELTVSDIMRVDTVDTLYHFEVKSQVGGTVRLYMYIQAAALTSGFMRVMMHRRYVPGYVQLRYSNDENFCKIIYDQGYENAFFLNAQQVIDENSINGNVLEDDEANKYMIIGTDQKWNATQLVGSECMLNALSLLRIHDHVKIILETGEVMDVAELLMEQSVVSYHAALIRLIYREESCSADNCGFEVCCPTPDTPICIGYFNGAGALPAAADFNGRYAMVETAPRQWEMYLSDGAAWNNSGVYKTPAYCIELQGFPYAYDTHNIYMRFYHTAGASAFFRPFIEINTVVDATAGIATITTYADYVTDGDVCCDDELIYCQVEYYDGTDWEPLLPYFDEENWHTCTDRDNLEARTGARVYSCECGAGTFYFRIHIFTASCDYGYSIPLQQTIT